MKSTQDDTAALERRAEHLRCRVDLLLDEADRRRHALTDAVNLRHQARMHPGVSLGIAGGMLVAAVALPILGIRRRRRRDSLGGRAAALREAFGRMMKRPNRVAEGRPHLPMKVLSAFLAAAASTIAKKEIGKLLSGPPRRQRTLALTPAETALAST
jgi:hypothetical protein